MSSAEASAAPRPVPRGVAPRRRNGILRDLALLAVAVGFVVVTLVGVGPRPAANVVAAVADSMR